MADNKLVRNCGFLSRDRISRLSLVNTIYELYSCTRIGENNVRTKELGSFYLLIFAHYCLHTKTFLFKSINCAFIHKHCGIEHF